MKRIIRSDASHPDFKYLVRHLDAELALRDGDEHDFYHQFNQITHIKHVVLLYLGNRAVACGAIKAYDRQSMEVKRMYTLPEQRGKGLAQHVLEELEHWSSELRYTRCLLETGLKQPEAIALYKRCHYTQIPNYGQYQGVENSVCFEKMLMKS